MRLPPSSIRREADFDSMMTPMIDVVFLLLVFFIWTSSIAVIEYVLPSQVSAQIGTQPTDLEEPPPERDFKDVVVKISWDGNLPSWFINDVPAASLAEVDQQLQAIAEIKLDAPVIVHPEKVVPVGFVIEIVDVAKLAGFERISFAIEHETL